MSITPVAPAEVGFDAHRLERIRPAMQAYIDSGKIAGISTLLTRRGKVVHQDQVGWMDIEANKPMSEDALFRIYSMTKPIVCVALMTLYEQGRFQLFDPVAKYLPAFQNPKVLTTGPNGGIKQVTPTSIMTVCDLMTHTAGFAYDFSEETHVAALYREARLLNNAERTLEEMVNELARLPLAFAPGSRWHYSLSIDVAAHLVEMLSGRPLDVYLRETIFEPLGMRDTAFHVPAQKQDRLAAMYGRRDLCAPGMTSVQLFALWQQEPKTRLDVSATYPADRPGKFARGGHGLFSTIGDYARFAHMLLQRGELDGARILGRKTVELMHSNHLSPARLPILLEGGVPMRGYGFGLGSRVLLDVADSQMPGSVGEFGWGGAARTYYWVDPQEEIVGLLMAQDLSGFDLVQQDFRVLAYQALVD